MTDKEKIQDLYNNACIEWRNNKGIGTVITPKPLSSIDFLLTILNKLYVENDKSLNTAIIVPTYQTRLNILDTISTTEGITHDKLKEAIENKKIKVFTDTLFNNHTITSSVNLVIVYQCDSICGNMKDFVTKTKFKLLIHNSVISDYYNIAPILNSFKHIESGEIRSKTPVEERQIGITIPDDSEEYKLLNYYNDYITTSINIFGSFEAIDEARKGNSLGFSANQICTKIAEDNGWSPTLDMSIEFNEQLDNMYNPNNIRERATMTYEIIRNRSTLLSDYNGKLEEIYNIITKHKNEKILIINKRGNFASKVTEYINSNIGYNICGNYHNDVESIPEVDIYGEPVFYKSGAKCGERKMMAAKKQKTLNNYWFNEGHLDVLSCNSAPDKDLDCAINVMIITSPLCESIKSYIYRLNNVTILGEKLIVYSLYVDNSLEEKKLLEKEPLENHTIISKIEKKFVTEPNNFNNILA